MSANFTSSRLLDGTWIRVGGDDAPALNASESNTSHILASLGLNPNFYSEYKYPIEQFHAECVSFLRIGSGVEADAPVALSRDRNFIDCGRREGYVTEKVQRLIEVVEFGLLHGATHILIG